MNKETNINSNQIKEITIDLIKSIQVQYQKSADKINLIKQNIIATINIEEVKLDTDQDKIYSQFKTYLQSQTDQMTELLRQSVLANKQKELLNKLEEFVNRLNKDLLGRSEKYELAEFLDFIQNQQFLKTSTGIEQILQLLYQKLEVEPQISSLLEVSFEFNENEYDKMAQILFTKIKQRYTQHKQNQQQHSDFDCGDDDDVVFVTSDEMQRYEEVTNSQKKKEYEEIVKISQNEQQDIEIIERESDYESDDDDELLEVNENAVESQVCQVQAHSKYALCVRILKEFIISGGGDDSITISQIDKNEEGKLQMTVKQKLQNYHDDSIDKLQVNSSETLLCSLGLDNKLLLFSIEKNFTLITQVAREFEILSFEWHQKADVILVGAKDGILGLFSGKSGDLLQGAKLMISGDQEDIETVSISKGQGKMACSLDNEGIGIKCWFLKESRLIAALKVGSETNFHKKDTQINVIEWMGDEALVTGASDGTICQVIVSEQLKHLRIAQQMKISPSQIECMVNTKNDELLVGGSDGYVYGVWMAKGIIRFKIQISDTPLLEIILKDNIVCGRTAKGDIFCEEYNTFIQSQAPKRMENKYQVHGVDVTSIGDEKYIAGVCDDGLVKLWKI